MGNGAQRLQFYFSSVLSTCRLVITAHYKDCRCVIQLLIHLEHFIDRENAIAILGEYRVVRCVIYLCVVHGMH